MISPRFLTHCLKLPLAFAQVAIHYFPVRHIEGERSENLFKPQRRERFSNSLGGLSPEECVNHRIQGNTGTCDVISPAALLDVLLGHDPLQYNANYPGTPHGRLRVRIVMTNSAFITVEDRPTLRRYGRVVVR